MTRTEFFELLKKSNLSRVEQKRLFRSMRKSIVLFYLGRRKYERDRFQEDDFQNKLFEKILKSDAREFKKLIYILKLDEINLKLDATKKKSPAHILARFILEKKVDRFEKFLRIGWQNKKHFQKAAKRYEWKLKHAEEKEKEKKANGKSWKRMLVEAVVVVSVGVGIGVGTVTLLKKVTEKKEGEK